MKHLKPPGTGKAPAADAKRQRRTAARFGFSAIIASFVVLGMLILGGMFKEEYEEGFVRIVSFAVRLATPEEVAEAEAQGPIPAALPSIRPDTPIVVASDPLIITREWQNAEAVLPVTEALIPIEGFVVETPEGLELQPPAEPVPDSQDSQEEAGETE